MFAVTIPLEKRGVPMPSVEKMRYLLVSPKRAFFYFQINLTNKVVRIIIMTRIVVNYFERRVDGISK